MTFEELQWAAESQGWTVTEEAGRWVFVKGRAVERVAKPLTARSLDNLIDALRSHGLRPPQ